MSTDPKTASTELTFTKIRNYLDGVTYGMDGMSKRVIDDIRDFLETYYWQNEPIEMIINDLGIHRDTQIPPVYRPLANMVIGLLEMLTSSNE
ncbi:hypothetical protein [Ktedonospora formicarum]|uniref:Uncharacterized protein n=1 Tax=Ktedonospora formicarum TaxID=2778364 RepID=A0A8J3HWQ0_9CHLR|nr:hypothetical protein [Ktedonospora formicarum]GHO45164.1 hypothetical protein KSX_33270 [Ktedonospora formicarum]